jgi:hypothetical protein
MVIMRILVIALSKRDYFGYPQGIILQNFADSLAQMM